MPKITELISFIALYPVWLKWPIMIWMVAGFVLLLLCIYHYPKKGVKIDEVRVTQDKEDHSTTLDIYLSNGLAKEVNVTDLQLYFFGSNKPKGGLQSYQKASAIYSIQRTEDDNRSLVKSDNDKMEQNIDVEKPFQGQDYAEVKVPISQKIGKEGTDRFIVRIYAEELLKSSYLNVEVKIRYDGKQWTQSIIMPLQ